MKKRLNADYVRENFPVCVKFADAMRKEFGDGVKIVWAKENGKEIGRPTTGEYSIRLSDINPEPLKTKQELMQAGRDVRW